jgi:hypothetical protein
MNSVLADSGKKEAKMRIVGGTLNVGFQKAALYL